MTEKYYTPNIEEFHIGFEYEEKSFESWTKQVYDKYTPILNKELCDDYGVPYDTIQDCINAEGIRVKYLDKEDIESLGFIYKINEDIPGYLVSPCYVYNKSSDLVIKYRDCRNLKIITLDKWRTPPRKKILFDGVIKNKSELIKLLKQLEIND